MLFEHGETQAVIEASRLGQLRTGAASAVAAKHLAKPAARTLGVIGCGYQARTQVACIREALPGIEETVAYCRNEKSLKAFCKEVGAEAGESHRDAAACDVVVTMTTSRDPVLRGEWLQAGRARLRRRREPSEGARARQHRPRARGVRLLRLARATRSSSPAT